MRNASLPCGARGRLTGLEDPIEPHIENDLSHCRDLPRLRIGQRIGAAQIGRSPQIGDLPRAPGSERHSSLVQPVHRPRVSVANRHPRRTRDTVDLSDTLRFIALSAALTIYAPSAASAALLSSCSPTDTVDAFTCAETVNSGLREVESTNGIPSLDKRGPLTAAGLFPSLTDVKVGGAFPVDSNLVLHAGSPLPNPARLGVSQLFTFAVGRDASSAYLASPAAMKPAPDPLRFVSLDGAIFPIAATVTLTSLVPSSLDRFAGLSPFAVSGSGGDTEEAPNSSALRWITLIYGFGTERIAIALLSLALLLAAFAGPGLVRWRRRRAMRGPV